MKHDQKFIYHVGQMTFANLAAGFLAFVYMLLAARILGVEQYGLFQAVMGILGIFTLYHIPLIMAVLHCVGTTSDDLKPVVTGEFLRLVLLIGAVTVILLASASPWISAALKAPSVLPVMAVAILFSLSGIAAVYYGTLQAKQSFGLLAVLKIAESLILLIGGTLFLVVGSGVTGAILGYIAGKTVLLGHFLTRKNGFKMGKGFPHIKRELLVVRNLALIFGFVMLLDSLPMILARIRLPHETSGLFAVLYNLRNTVWPFAFAVAIPFYSQLITHGEDKRVAKKATLLILGIGTGFTAAGILFPGWIIRILYGSNYAAAAKWMAAYGVSLLLQMLGMIFLFQQAARREFEPKILILPLAVLLILLGLPNLSIGLLIGAPITSAAFLLILMALSRLRQQG